LKKSKRKQTKTTPGNQTLEKTQKKANTKSTNAERNGKYKEHFVFLPVLLLCSYLFFWRVFAFFSEKRSEQKQQKKLLFNVFLLFSCGFFLNVLFVFCFFQLHFVACVG